MEFSFFLLIAMLFLVCKSLQVYRLIFVCFMHEMGHLATIAACGVSIKKVIFSGFGIRIVTEKNGAEPLWRSLLILLSGPFANFVIYALLQEKQPDTAMMSFSAGVYNLLPYRQLDGGAALDVLFTGNVHEREVNAFLNIVRIVFIAVSGVGVIVYGTGLLPFCIALVLLYLDERK